jgi:hypothetical protein
MNTSEKARKDVLKNTTKEFQLGDYVRVKLSQLYSQIRKMVKDGDKKYIVVKYSPEIYVIDHILKPDREGYEKLRYTLKTLGGEKLLTQQKMNNPNKPRRQKRFFASDFLRATDDSETTNLTSKDVLKLSKLSAEPQKRKRKVQQKRIKTIVSMETILYYNF